MRIASLGVLFCALLGSPILAAPRAPTAVAPGTATWTLARDVMLLMQINSLHLTKEQVQKILAVYSRHQASTTEQDQRVAQLYALRERLLKGEEVSMVELRDAMRIIRGRGQPGTEKELIAGEILDLLEPWQQLVLSGGARAFVAKQGVLQQKMGDPLVDALIWVAQIPEDQWASTKKEILERVASPVPQEERDNYKAAMSDFLDRLRSLGPDEVRAKGRELVQEMQALADARVPAALLLRPIDKEWLLKSVSQLFLQPSVPTLLREMAETRGWSVQEPQDAAK
ncbi:MAG: hypothetical protein J7M26_06135 [Armatimonadetes bacterium]|nr:hypothetical protein [Armatimonadota bacterium]